MSASPLSGLVSRSCRQAGRIVRLEQSFLFAVPAALGLAALLERWFGGAEICRPSAQGGADHCRRRTVLAVDISYSMDLDELALQREGYVQALTSPEFLNAIKQGMHGKIAVTYFEWAGASDQKEVMPAGGSSMVPHRPSGCRHHCRGADPPFVSHIDFGRAAVRGAAVRQFRPPRHPACDRRVG